MTMDGDPLGARGPLNLSRRLSVCRNERAAHWDAAYAKCDAGRSRFQAEAGPSLEAIGATGAGPDDAIIDVGGGSSRLVDGLLGRGFRDLTVLDVSSVALRRARARLADRAGKGPGSPIERWQMAGMAST